MATPQTYETRAHAFMAISEWLRESGELYRVPSLMGYIGLLRPVYLQRPRTGDMMQMCVDLGIDVPDFQPVSWDGKTFRIEKPRPETMQQFHDLYVEKWEITHDL